MKLFVVLVCAHVLGDFLLQPNRLVENKHRFLILGFHSVIQAFLAWLFVGHWLLWKLPVIVLLSHLLIDLIKRQVKDTALAFVADQTLHVIVLIALAVGLNRAGFAEGIGWLYKPLTLFCGFVATVCGSGFLVAKVAGRLIEENDLKLSGLKRGGRLIGQLERSLIFLLILIGQPAGIGFLVAAKSILRFKETEEQKLAEYVLIGTLLSFGLAIALSVLTIKAMKL